MNNITNLLQNWIIAEPVAGLWLGIVAVLLFGVTFAQLTKRTGMSWGRGFFVALAQTLIVVSLVVCWLSFATN